MQRRNAAIAVVTLSLSAFFAARGWWKPAETDNAGDATSTAEIESPKIVRPAEAPPELPKAPVAPSLRVGDAFHYERTVEQKVTQPGQTGPLSSQSSLAAEMELRVEEIRDGSKRLRVRYHRVRYSQDVAGEHVEFDSASLPASVPVPARAYHGLVNNGFDLWMGPDHRPAGIEGFDAFLMRCVRDVPGEERQAFSSALVGMSADDSIANFIDESIGLLPYISGATDGGEARVGTQWEQQRHVEHPYPLELTNACTLKSVDEQAATIEIVGAIHPSRNYAAVPPSDGTQVKLRGGRSAGHCIISRRTGLPVSSHIERTLDLVVQPGDGTAIEQQKYVVSSIRSLDQNSSPGRNGASPALANEIAPPPPEDTVVPASFENGNAHRESK